MLGDQWTKSSVSTSGGANCLEVRVFDGLIWVRNSKIGGEGTPFDPADWEAFLVGAKSGEFDLP